MRSGRCRPRREAGKVTSKEDRRAARTRLAARVDEIWRQVLEHDWKSCRLWPPGAHAQAALGELEGAIASYREVVEWSSGDYAVSVVEHLANCEVRLAQKRFRIAGAATTEVIEYLERRRHEARRACPSWSRPASGSTSAGASTRSGRRCSTTKPGTTNCVPRTTRIAGRARRSGSVLILESDATRQAARSHGSRGHAHDRGCRAADRQYRGTTTCRGSRLLDPSRSGRRLAHSARPSERARTTQCRTSSSSTAGSSKNGRSGANATRRSATCGTYHDSIRSLPKRARS